MLLTSGSIAPNDHDVASPLYGHDGETVASVLQAQVRSTFPDVPFSTARLEERGGDHRVLVLDDTYAFRFPRQSGRSLGLEIEVLDALRGRCEVALPSYRFVDPARRFAGYRFIAGDELTPRRYAVLPAEVQHHVLDQVGRFLAVLHSLAPAEIFPVADWPIMATAAEHAAHAHEHRLPQLIAAFPQLTDPLHSFYESYAAEAVGHQVILHGDLVSDHLILAPDGERLAGIIDFGDVALGDPAQDLLGFWAYGPGAVARVIAAYGAAHNPDLRERSLRAFVRYRIDRFSDQLISQGAVIAKRSLPELAQLVVSHSDQPKPRK